MSTLISTQRTPLRSRGMLRQKKRRSKPFVVWMLILLFGWPALSFGQAGKEFCDMALTPVEDKALAYEGRGGNRCEGLYTARVGGQFEVVSLLIGTLDYLWLEDTDLTVSSPHVTASGVNIRAVALPEKTYYRMDSRLDPQGHLTWSTGEVLVRERLAAGDVGVFGWVAMERGREFVPVQVVRAGGTAEGNAPIHLGLRPSVDMENVSWRHARFVDGDCREWTQPEKVFSSRVDSISFSQGDLIPVVLPERRSAVECVEIYSREAGGDWLEKPFKLRMRRSDAP